MASRAELEAQSASQAAVVALAWTQLQTGFAELGMTGAGLRTEAGVAAVVELFADIVSAWGEVAGTLAADFYDELRDRAGLADGFSALVPDPLNLAQVEGNVRIAVQAVRPPEPDPFTLPESNEPSQADVDAFLAKLEGPAQRLVRQAQRAAIDESARRDPSPRVRVARIPMGAETCAFCLVLASRGYVYRSEESAGDGNRYHDFCDCEQDVSFDATPEPPEGYDIGDYYARYEQAVVAAGTTNLRKVLAELRRQEGIR